MELRKIKIRVEKASRYIKDGKTVVREAKYENGLFHCWEHYKDENFSGIWAIVELQDGNVKQVEVDAIQFTDKDPTKNITF